MWGWIAAGMAYLWLRPKTRAERDADRRREAWRKDFDRKQREFAQRWREAREHSDSKNDS